MKTRPASLGAVLLAVFCLYNIAHATETLDITHPWVREAPPSARVLAAYMSIKNTSGVKRSPSKASPARNLNPPNYIAPLSKKA